jgi:hypothetical protein
VFEGKGEKNIITWRFISLDAPRVSHEQNKLDQKQFSSLFFVTNENTTSQIGNRIELVLLSSHRSFSLWCVCVMCQGHRYMRADQSICRSFSSPLSKELSERNSIAKKTKKNKKKEVDYFSIYFRHRHRPGKSLWTDKRVDGEHRYHQCHLCFIVYRHG